MKTSKEVLLIVCIILILSIVSIVVIRGIKIEKENRVRNVILNLEDELVYEFSAFENMQEEYIINGKKVNINLYKEKIDNSFEKIEEYKIKIGKNDLNCDRNSNSIDKRIVFLNNTYNMLKSSEETVITSYSSGNFDGFEDILKCVNGYLRDSFYDTKNHDF